MLNKELQLLTYFRGEVSEIKIADYLLCTAYLYFKPKGRFSSNSLNILNDITSEQKVELIEFVQDLNDVKAIIECFYRIKRKYGLYSGSISANNQINKLIIKILKIEKDDVVLDLCSGYSEFLFELAKEWNNEIAYKGIEINTEQVFISNLIFDLLELDFNLINENALFSKLYEYDKGYVFPPLAIKYNDDTYQRFYTKNKSLFNSRTTSEWFFVDRLLSKMKENGKCISLLSKKPLFFNDDNDYRNYLLENHLLEGIIELPSGILSPYTNVPMTLLVFSNENKKVKIIDGNNYIVKTNKNKDVEIKLAELLDDYLNNNCIMLTTNEIKEKNTFLVNNLLSKPKEINFGRTFENVAKISQGSQYTVSNFKDKITDEKTNYRILTSSDIENGCINFEKLQYIENNDEKLLKHRLQKNDLVMTSKSSKVKIAIVDFEPQENIIVTGGMFIIRPNIDEINPLFLKMFFESKTGIEQLKSIQKGSIIPTIPMKMLKELTISCPPLEEQNHYAKKYNSKLNMYIAMKKELEQLEESLKNFYESIFEGKLN